MVTILDESTTQDHNVSMMVSTNQTSHDMVTTPNETAGVYCCLFSQIEGSVSNRGGAYDVDTAFFFLF